jgi:hypothetical protein
LVSAGVQSQQPKRLVLLAGRAERDVPNPIEGVYSLTGVQPGFGFDVSANVIG